ncbi:hypothetical protein PoB_005058400 [Plakobranchus ocellatus]|uniref:Uncharacterized protein n=1 Tax=Plakobranchus ocellatus TaxID=259542 RepID=A0AAV4BV53_9GAST|nr:hypothetical protein PoB_005058400 [Plakobranchus ocellatus]
MGQTDDIGKNWKKQKASLMMVPAVGGRVNRKSASDLKGVFCQEFELHHLCCGLIEGLQTSDHLDDENANHPGSVYRRHNHPTPGSNV